MMPRSAQKSWILALCNSSCVHKRQDITSIIGSPTNSAKRLMCLYIHKVGLFHQRCFRVFVYRSATFVGAKRVLLEKIREKLIGQHGDTHEVPRSAWPFSNPQQIAASYSTAHFLQYSKQRKLKMPLLLSNNIRLNTGIKATKPFYWA